MTTKSQYPDYVMGFIRDRLTIAVLDGIWHDVRMEYGATGLLTYRAVHEMHDVAITDPDWEVWKYTYSGSDIVRIEGPLHGSWDGRALLEWGS
jgi:hypothetical protein